MGIGFRKEIEEQILESQSCIDWLELIAEHYIGRPPERVAEVTRLNEVFSLVPHGVELSIGTSGDLDARYVDDLALFVHSINAPWFSDHLSFTRAGDIALGHLTPVVRTWKTVEEIAQKVRHLQGHVGLPFLLENITYYVDFPGELSESEFISAILEQCDCGLLLDLTNVFINATNHKFDAREFLDQIPLGRVVQVHLSGGTKTPQGLIDSHSSPVPPEVFDLLRYTVRGAENLKAIMIERDQNYPANFEEITRDLLRARQIWTLTVSNSCS